MKATVAASMRQGNHGPQARSICKKISPQHAQTGKHEYFLKAEIHGRSKPWEFFTEDTVQRPAKPNPLRSHSIASNPWIVRRAVCKAWKHPIRGMFFLTRKWSL